MVFTCIYMYFHVWGMSNLWLRIEKFHCRTSATRKSVLCCFGKISFVNMLRIRLFVLDRSTVLCKTKWKVQQENNRECNLPRVFIRNSQSGTEGKMFTGLCIQLNEEKVSNCFQISDSRALPPSGVNLFNSVLALLRVFQVFFCNEIQFVSTTNLPLRIQIVSNSHRISAISITRNP